jgi:hypothetical protein
MGRFVEHLIFTLVFKKFFCRNLKVCHHSYNKYMVTGHIHFIAQMWQQEAKESGLAV